MGFSGTSLGSILLILLIIGVLFGTKRISQVAEDLGKAVKKFRQGMNETENNEKET